MTKTDPALCTRTPTTEFKNACRGKEDSRKVQCHGKGKVPPDGAHHFLRHLQQMRQLFEVFVHKGDSAAPAAISLPTPPMAMLICAFFQRGCIVHAVAYHAHLSALLLAGAYPLLLVLRQATRPKLLYAKLPRNGAGRLLIVARKQHGRRAARLHRLITSAASGRSGLPGR